MFGKRPAQMIAPGVKLGRHEIRSQIGAGGMGEVYRARDMEIGRDVAVKVLPSTLSANTDRLQRFQQEACAARFGLGPNVYGPKAEPRAKP